MAAHNELGKEGELLAANHLQSEGYVIRHRDWRCGHKELDIVAEKDGTLVFVEVKTRKDVLFGLPTGLYGGFIVTRENFSASKISLIFLKSQLNGLSLSSR